MLSTITTNSPGRPLFHDLVQPTISMKCSYQLVSNLFKLVTIFEHWFAAYCNSLLPTLQSDNDSESSTKVNSVYIGKEIKNASFSEQLTEIKRFLIFNLTRHHCKILSNSVFSILTKL